MDQTVREEIKMRMLQALGSEVKSARRVACQIVAYVATIEVPKGWWDNIVDILSQQVSSENQVFKQAALETLGFFSEEIDEDDLAPNFCNALLKAMLTGMQDSVEEN